MSKLKITQGVWEATGTYVGVKNNRICYADSTLDGYEEDCANAILIADAGTTYNQCGLLPSELLRANEIQQNEHKEEINELLQQNDELKAMLVLFSDYCNPSLDTQYEFKRLEMMKKANVLLTKYQNK